MAGLFTAPYNDSMRLGQGYNSFLQIPRVHNAVYVRDVFFDKGNRPQSVAQTVSYSMRFVNKISEVAKTMNISAGTAIKAGTLSVASSSFSFDEVKFAASDLNAVVSVKVYIHPYVYENDRSVRTGGQSNVPSYPMNSKRFHDHYGDCYISGFIEGGDLHGVVSIKVIDSSKKETISSQLKSFIHSVDDGEFTLSKSRNLSELTSMLRETETCITVNYSGGGIIKPDGAEWTLETLLQVAATFPERVAQCPQRTNAILTRYERNIPFCDFARHNHLVLRDYSTADRYVSDLLDMYMEWKNNLCTIENILTNPQDYVISEAWDAINVNVELLVHYRKHEVKKAMSLIVQAIEQINSEPEKVGDFEIESKISPPELFTPRLPVLKAEAEDVDLGNGSSDLSIYFPQWSLPMSGSSVKATINGRAVARKKKLQEIALGQHSLPGLFDSSNVGDVLSDREKKWLTAENNRKTYASYRFGKPQGSPGTDKGSPGTGQGSPGTANDSQKPSGDVPSAVEVASGADDAQPQPETGFNDAVSLEGALIPATWPKRIEFYMVPSGNHRVLGCIRTIYDRHHLTHGSRQGRTKPSDVRVLQIDERICRILLHKASGVSGVTYIEFETNKGEHKYIGTKGAQDDIVDCKGFDGTLGLKGFYGEADKVVDRLGPIWGEAE